MAAAIRLSQQHSCSLPDASRAPDRKDSTPRHGRLLHPSSWAERDDRDHAAENFFQGGSPKIGHPISPARTSSPPEIVSDHISGGEARMNFQISRALPTGGLRAPRQDRWQWFLSPKLLCDALHRASPDPKRLGHLQDTHTLRKLLSHLAFGRAVYLRPAELHALSNGALEPCFDPLADHRPLKLSKGAG